MADQKTTDAGVAALLKTYYNRMLIERLEPESYLYQLGEKKPIPKGNGKTIEFTGWRKVKPILSNSSEMSTSQVYLSAYTISTTLIQRHNYAQFSTLLKQTSIDPNIESATEILADQLRKTVEMYIRYVVVGKICVTNRATVASINTSLAQHDADGVITGTSGQLSHILFSQFPMLHNKTRLSSSACKFGTLAGSAMSISQIKHAVSYLKSRNVKPFADGKYVLYAHTWVVDKLMADPAWKTWNSPNNADKMWKGEVGQLYGARIIEGNMAFRYVYSSAPLTTASGAFNVSMLFGKGAFGVSELSMGGNGNKGFEIIVKNPSPYNTNDPVDLISTVGGKMCMAAVVLNKSAACGICTSDRSVSSGT